MIENKDSAEWVTTLISALSENGSLGYLQGVCKRLLVSGVPGKQIMNIIDDYLHITDVSSSYEDTLDDLIAFLDGFFF